MPKVRAEDVWIGRIADSSSHVADRNPFNIKAPHLVQVVQYVFSGFIGITGRQRDQKGERSHQQQLMLKIEANLVGDVPYTVKMLFLKSRKNFCLTHAMEIDDLTDHSKKERDGQG